VNELEELREEIASLRKQIKECRDVLICSATIQVSGESEELLENLSVATDLLRARAREEGTAQESSYEDFDLDVRYAELYSYLSLDQMDELATKDLSLKESVKWMEEQLAKNFPFEVTSPELPSLKALEDQKKRLIENQIADLLEKYLTYQASQKTVSGIRVEVLDLLGHYTENHLPDVVHPRDFWLVSVERQEPGMLDVAFHPKILMDKDVSLVREDGGVVASLNSGLSARADSAVDAMAKLALKYELLERGAK
jgi:hypothetical protein